MIFRIVILLISTLIAYLVGLKVKGPIWGLDAYYVYPGLTVILGALVIGLEITAHQANGRKIYFATIGIILGWIVGWFLGEVFVKIIPGITNDYSIVLELLLAYVGFTLGWLKEEDFKVSYSASTQNVKEGATSKIKILDTSVVIDGRIADIAETGFLEGVLVVPKFVLNELHQVADSSDPLKRSRGRRGLDILNNMKASKTTVIKITEEDFPETPEVDSKLLKLAIQYGNAVIVTNDFNLNKVAEFQGVSILNINELANAVKPVLLPNEEIRITVIKEGKDQNQGIAYLDDGTMIVIDNGKHYIGREINVVVTSILQTPAGRMIFTQINDSKK
ncbi:MAG: PIN domain-containing protein [Spirochaetota bacterium]|nr:PIN domain-containing protein [Spirochaetota bacterium]